MKCRYCKKTIKELEPYQRIKLSYVHVSCLDDYIKSVLEKVEKKREKSKKSLDKAKSEHKKSTFKKSLWTRYFSPYIRQRDANKQGQAQCISCGKIDYWKKMDAGHFIPKSAGEFFYFNEDNVHAQCPKCNRYGSHDTGGKFEENLRKKIGDEKVDFLIKAKNRRITFSQSLKDYKKLRDKYKKLLKF